MGFFFGELFSNLLKSSSSSRYLALEAPSIVFYATIPFVFRGGTCTFNFLADAVVISFFMVVGGDSSKLSSMAPRGSTDVWWIPDIDVVPIP